MLALYSKWALQHRFTVAIAHHTFGHAILTVEGENAGACFAREGGKHCVQRVPPTERSGRRHTSMVAVAVMRVRERSESFDPKDVDVTTQRGHGKGGQNQNKVESAVCAVHRPTGISVFINGRDQHQNRRTALEILSQRVKERAASFAADRDAVEKRSQIGFGTRSDKLRTYNFIEGRIVDHALGIKRFTDVVKWFKKGDLGMFYA
jgi:peptide chain release factor 1